MSDFRAGRDVVREFAAAYCNESLDDEQFAVLQRQLLSDARARGEFRRYMALDTALYDYGERSIADWPSNPEPSRVHGRLLPMTVLGALIVTAAALLLIGNLNHSSGHQIAEIEQATGDVRVYTADGQVRAVHGTTALESGDTVRTRGNESSTVLAYTDGTRVTLVGNTSVTSGDRDANSLVVHQGKLAAFVQPQTNPLRLATPSARLEVLGTKFQLESLEHRTDVRVTEGLVRVVRVHDGDSVDVGDGKFASVTEKSPLRVEDVSPLPTSWELDFEQGLPEDWGRGHWIDTGLPQGSRGGVRGAAGMDEGGHPDDGIKTQMDWLQGLFAVENDSHFHMTFKMERPNWINILVVTRTADAEAPRFAGNYIFRGLPRPSADRWYRVSIPLSKFERVHAGDVALTDLVPYKLSIDADIDRGIVIDRMGVTPHGPGEVVMHPLVP